MRNKKKILFFLPGSVGGAERVSITISKFLDPDEYEVVYVVLAKNKKGDVAEEARFAYKDINDVMANQQDLTEPVKRLFTVGVVKG